MGSTSTQRATLADLAKVDGKAELIAGRIVKIMPTGFLPSRIAARIYRSLDDHAEQSENTYALTDGVGYAVEELPSGRESFSPDVSYFAGELPENQMGFIQGAPDFAVEVRSENGYSTSALADAAAKRVDYFAAGTQVVWDVDPQAGLIHCYRADNPGAPIVFQQGQQADAEPAVPGWSVEVDQIFPAQ